MNKPMMAAAVLSAATFGLHVLGGGRDVHIPIQASDLDVSLRAISAVLWHFASLVLALQTIAFWALSQRANPTMGWLLIGVQGGTAALFLFYGATLLGTIWIMPQWTIFLALAALGLWGQKR